MKRGRPFEAGNKLGRGRPKGSRNKVTAEAQELLYEFKEPLLRKCIAKAIGGDVRALALCIERILPPLREPTVRFRMPKVEKVNDAERASQIVMENLAKGNLTPNEAETIHRLVANVRDHLVVADFGQRIAKVEKFVEHGAAEGSWPST